MDSEKELPEGWKKEFSRSQQRDYFYHAESKRSVWSIEEVWSAEKKLQSPQSTHDKPDVKRRNESEREEETFKERRHRDDGDDGRGYGREDRRERGREKRDRDYEERDRSYEKRDREREYYERDRRRSSNSNVEESMSGKRTREANGEGEGSLKRVKDAAEGEKTNVIVIVPFRDLHEQQQRKKHLDQFVPYMSKFLEENPAIGEYHILVVEQSDDGRKFNRGKLLNIGFKYACEKLKPTFHSFIFHDVDLLPQKPLEEWYAKIPKTPIHIAKCWDRYNNNPKYFGGIVAISRNDFRCIDGFPNTFWGWGGEDDELLSRVQEARLQVKSPPKALPDAVVDLEGMDLKTKLDLLKTTDWKCNVKWEARDEYTKYRKQKASIPWWGLSGIEYKLLEEEKLAENATKITVDVLYNFNSDGTEHWANRKTDWSN